MYFLVNEVTNRFVWYFNLCNPTLSIKQGLRVSLYVNVYFYNFFIAEHVTFLYSSLFGGNSTTDCFELFCNKAYYDT